MAMLVNDYLDQHTALNHPLTFAEPFLASTVRAIEAGDESWRRLESFDASLYEEVGYVFTLMNPLRGGAAQEEWMPWPLKLTEGEEPLLTMNMTVMVVNPYGKEQEKARQLADFCAGHWDGETGLLLSAAWEGPTENRHYREEAAALNEEIALLEAKGDRDGLEAAQRELERLAPMRWDISPEQAAWYQEHAGQVRIGGGNGFLCTAKAQLGRIITAFGQGGMPWERALEELQRMAQMERMESE